MTAGSLKIVRYRLFGDYLQEIFFNSRAEYHRHLVLASQAARGEHPSAETLLAISLRLDAKFSITLVLDTYVEAHNGKTEKSFV